jgi:hypothetical protein
MNEIRTLNLTNTNGNSNFASSDDLEKIAPNAVYQVSSN